MHHPCTHISSVFDNRHNGPQPAAPSPHCPLVNAQALTLQGVSICYAGNQPLPSGGRPVMRPDCGRHPNPIVSLELPGEQPEQPLSVSSAASAVRLSYTSYHTKVVALSTANHQAFYLFCTSSFNIGLPSIYSSSIAAKRFHTTSILLAECPHVLLYFAFTRRLSWVWPCSFNPTGWAVAAQPRLQSPPRN